MTVQSKLKVARLLQLVSGSCSDLEHLKLQRDGLAQIKVEVIVSTNMCCNGESPR